MECVEVKEKSRVTLFSCLEKIVKSKRLSWAAKGVLFYLLFSNRKPLGSKEQILTDCYSLGTAGKTAIKTILKDLVEVGVLEHNQFRFQRQWAGSCVVTLEKFLEQEK